MRRLLPLMLLLVPALGCPGEAETTTTTTTTTTATTTTPAFDPAALQQDPAIRRLQRDATAQPVDAEAFEKLLEKPCGPDPAEVKCKR